MLGESYRMIIFKVSTFDVTRVTITDEGKEVPNQQMVILG